MFGSTYAISGIIGTGLSRGDSSSETLVLTPPLSIPVTPLIVRSMRCRLVRNVLQRDSEIKLRAKLNPDPRARELEPGDLLWCEDRPMP